MLAAVIILAAGQGTRMQSQLPKVLHPIGGKAMVHHVIDTATQLKPKNIVVVTSPTLPIDKIAEERDLKLAVQEQALGTGHAVLTALSQLDDSTGDALILCGDTPLIQAETLHSLVRARQSAVNDDIIMLAMRLQDPRRYGRLITKGTLVTRIVEDKDACAEEKEITLCNPGIYLIPIKVLRQLLPQLSNDNAAKEIYLTDIIALAASSGINTHFVESDQPDTLHGVNNRVELALAEKCLQDRWRQQLMLSGVTMHDPDSVYLMHDTVIGRDVTLYPHVTFGLNVHIADQAIIYPYCHLSNCRIGEKAKVGPFAHLRDHVVLEQQAEVGNFVEVKNSTLAEKAKAKHLSYIGDAMIGVKANIGAGTITCNYNGYQKSKTIIGAGAFIGSNSSLVAPVTVGEGAIVAAGSVITKDVPENALGYARANQQNKDEWAIAFRQKFSSKLPK